jgi:DNA repair exonuclease SbcCD ATPase subunit
MAEQDPRLEHVYKEIMPILQEWERDIFPAIKNLEVEGLKEYATAERILYWIDKAKAVIEKHDNVRENLSKYVRVMVDNMYSNCVVQKAHIETEKMKFEDALTKLWTGDSLVKENLERTRVELDATKNALEAAKKDLEWLRSQHRTEVDALRKEGAGMQNLRDQLEAVTKQLDEIKFQLEEKDRILADADARLRHEEELRERAYRDLGEVKAKLDSREEKVRAKVRRISRNLNARYTERQAALERGILETKNNVERRYEELRARYDDVIAQLGEFKKQMIALAAKYETERARADQAEKKIAEMHDEYEAAKKEAYMLRGADQIKREIAESLEKIVDSYVAQDWRSLIDLGKILDVENYKYIYDELARICNVAAKIGDREKEMGGKGSYVMRFIRWLGYARRMPDFGGILDITARIAEKDAYRAIVFFTGPAMELSKEKVKSLKEKSAEELLAEV